MKMLLFTAILALVCGTESSVAQAMSGSVVDQRVTSLSEQLKRAVRTLSRPIVVYHFGKRAPIQYKDGQCMYGGCDEKINLMREDSYHSPVELAAPEGVPYFKAMTSMFARHQHLDWSMAGGLYAALDPVQSLGYARPPWFLLQITVPKGTKYLDTRNISVQLPGKSTMDLDSLIRISNNQEVIDAIASLKVDFIVYPWYHHSHLICGDKNSSLISAINFVNPDAAERMDLKILVEDFKLNQAPEKDDAYRAVLEQTESVDWMIKNGVVVRGKRTGVTTNPGIRDAGWETGTRIPVLFSGWEKALSVATYTNQQKLDVLDRVKQNTFGCSDAKDAEEESTPPKVTISVAR